ncbi:MAG: response regulator transcription factor [Candidatus Methanomethyliaceae archaeon]
MIRVILVDDHVVVRAGLRKLLEAAGGIEVVGEASSGEEGVRLARQLRPDVVVMDISMPGLGGIEATKRIAELEPAPAVLVLTVRPAEVYGWRLLQAGARGYLEKKAAPEDLVTAVHRVASGKYFVPEELEEILLKRASQKGVSSEVELLSDRELQVLLLFAQGKTTREVADSLYVSPKTVESYRARIRRKLGLRNPAEYLTFALSHGLMDHPETRN